MNKTSRLKNLLEDGGSRGRILGGEALGQEKGKKGGQESKIERSIKGAPGRKLQGHQIEGRG